MAPGQEVARGGALQARRGFGPIEGHARGDGNSVLGSVDGGGQDGVEAKQAEIGRQLAEGVDGPGHRGAQGTLGRHFRVARITKFGGMKPGRGTARAVQRDDAFIPGGFDQHETVAADAGHLGFCDAKQHGRADGGVNRVAATFQYGHGSLGSQRMRGGAHAVQSENGRAAGLVEISHGSSFNR